MRILVSSRGSAATVPPAIVRGWAAEGVPGAGAAADAVRALESDRGADHAFGADGPLAAGAADAGLAVRVAVAAGQALRVLRAAGLLVHEVP